MKYEEDSMSTPKVKGLHTWRFRSNPEEKRFALAWEKSNKEGNTLAYLLDTSQKGIPSIPSVRDQEVAATLIQWLGSHVGECFLRDLGYSKEKET
jgi:hypothetical protein